MPNIRFTIIEFVTRYECLKMNASKAIYSPYSEPAFAWAHRFDDSLPVSRFFQVAQGGIESFNGGHVEMDVRIRPLESAAFKAHLGPNVSAFAPGDAP
jgi:hypothetical protein